MISSQALSQLAFPSVPFILLIPSSLSWTHCPRYIFRKFLFLCFLREGVTYLECLRIHINGREGQSESFAAKADALVSAFRSLLAPDSLGHGSRGGVFSCLFMFRAMVRNMCVCVCVHRCVFVTHLHLIQTVNAYSAEGN